MKKYIVYPGIGRNYELDLLHYITGKQLAHNYRVPYSECLDADIPAIKKVLDFNKRIAGPPIHLIALTPRSDGFYKVPSSSLNKIIIAEGLPDMVNKNG